MSRPRALDLFCGAGGATRGLQLAGFHVTGVDLSPQPHYVGDEFHQADALTFPLEGYDLIWASPPCQGYLNEHFRVTPSGHVRRDHPRLIDAVRDRLQAAGADYIIENIPGARKHLRSPVTLCGSSFGLAVRRHRLFECSFLVLGVPCRHQGEAKYPTQYRPKNGQNPLSTVVQVYGHGKGAWLWGPAMGIDWMRREELAESIPPAYARYLGLQAIAALTPAGAVQRAGEVETPA